MVENKVDFLGAGFGPANLSVAVSLQTLPDSDPRKNLDIQFIEKKAQFSWHKNMLFDNAKMQVSFLKDLATLQDPKSPFTFINFLHEKGRLADYINLGTFYPYRSEFNEYLTWAADQIEDVTYSQEIQNLEPIVSENGEVNQLIVGCDQGETQYTTRGLLLSLGFVPKFPENIKIHKNSKIMFHNNEFLEKVAPFAEESTDKEWNFLIVGAGQSGAEVFNYLSETFNNSNVHMLNRSYGLMPANSSPFCNEVFNPEMVEYYYDLPREDKLDLLENLSQTNYSAVDDEDIETLFRSLYLQKIEGKDRLKFLRLTELLACEQVDQKVFTRIKDKRTKKETERHYDCVIFATGYEYSNVDHILGSLSQYIVRDEHGNIKISKNHLIETTDNFQVPIFLQGATEHSHGLTSSLLSVLSTRANTIVNTLSDYV
ncbi:hypothetical protein CGG83_05095 [Vibrio parahaemolyticus]|uniref:SidA/IucD/PvdA family monooxygenase n=1 Tax=Vibrio parahaemolyticus TaxID=670 RepID=UPI00111DE124|nr:SidA/IucD/PvdA family monooxygenase [Vibrio parahaemolyticus]TOR17844.1 hypothetical protein CGG83_05095 [Vibrio parahaemolyticus]TOR39410.1 hypothetical protein CGG76_13595 [Vibrio parahaemolyticus]